MSALSELHVHRYLFPVGYEAARYSIHVFSDASITGYGAVAHMRAERNDGDIRCAFLIGKSRVSPVKTVTIQRLELTAAVTALRLGRHMSHEFGMDPTLVSYYTPRTPGQFSTTLAVRVEGFPYLFQTGNSLFASFPVQANVTILVPA